MQISRKFKLVFGIISLLLLATAGHMLWIFTHMRLVLNELDQAFSIVLFLDDLKVLMYRQVKEIPDFITGRDPDAKEEFQSFSTQIAGRLTQGETLLKTPTQKRRLEELRIAYAELERLAHEIFRAYDSNRHQRALDLMENDVEKIALPALDQRVASLHQVLYATSFQKVIANATSLERTAQIVGLIAVLATVGVGLLIYVWLSRGLVGPINALVEATREVGRGNLDIHDLPLSSRDELGELASAFSAMLQQLRRLQIQLVETEQIATIGATAAAVAHGLRNPLSSVRALAQVALLEEELPSAAGERLRDIMAEVDRLSGRIDHLLAFAVPTPLRPDWVDLNRIIERVLADFQRTAPDHVTFALHRDPDLPAVRIDTVHVEETIREIVLNALEAMPDGGDIRVKTKRTGEAKGQPMIALEVTDTGRGIDPQTLPRVFEPFFTTRADGTGLGLSIVRRLVGQHGGTVEIESRSGQGTLVRLAFPANEPGEGT